MSYDPEKAPLIPTTEPSTTITSNGDTTPEEIERLHVALVDAGTAWRSAQKDYNTAWERTPAGRRIRRINTCILAFAGTIGGLVIGAMLTMIVYAAFFDLEDYDYDAPSNRTEYHTWNNAPKVQLEAHIMSKCPDARDCLRDLVLPAMVNVSDSVDFKLSFIGTATKDDGVICPHGPSECLGNILELCAASLYPSPKAYLGFTMCLSDDYSEIPSQELVKDCALEHGLSFEDLNKCASRDDGYGLGLLRDSIDRSKTAGVQKSCTVRLDGKEWCIRDGGEWKNCEDGHKPEDLVRDVLKAKKD